MVSLSLLTISCSSDSEENLSITENDVVGVWVTEVNGTKASFSFSENKNYVAIFGDNRYIGVWKLEGNTVHGTTLDPIEEYFTFKTLSGNVAKIHYKNSLGNTYELTATKYESSIEVSPSALYLDGKRNVSAVFSIKTKDSWSITGIPNWLNLDREKGFGDYFIQVTAKEENETGDNRETELTVKTNSGFAEIIKVIQEVPLYTCSEIITGPDKKVYRAKGVVTDIKNTEFGNWYLKDETGEIYIYGTLDSNGKTGNFLSCGLKVGDHVTVQGPKATYIGVAELVDVKIVSIDR